MCCLSLPQQQGPCRALGHQGGDCEGHGKVIKRKVTLGYVVREGQEEQGRGFNHSACSYVSGVAHRCLPKLRGIDEQRYCSSQREDGDLFPSGAVGWRWCSTAATRLSTSWTLSYPFSPQLLPVSGGKADAALPY